jgi:hypothetical protein
MDAQYLTKNVNTALTEALTSMTVSIPEDKVEYLGKYLIQYGIRRALKEKVSDEAIKAAAAGEKATLEEQIKEAEKSKLAQEVDQEKSLVPAFESQLSTYTEKKEAMDAVCKFLAEYLRVPAAYIAVKKVAGESEYLQYVSASPGQEHVIGKKLSKPVEEGDEPPVGQGFSFEAFKIPEPPEEVVDDEGNPIPQPPPVAQPIVIDNVMRDPRCSFFGIPKLGAFGCKSFQFASCDHENGCIDKASAPPSDDPPPEEGAPPAEPDNSPFKMNKIATDFIVCVDTIGSYRTLKPSDMELIQKLGKILEGTLESADKALYGKQVAFLELHASKADPIKALIAQAPTTEAQAAEAAGKAFEEALTQPPEPDADPENEAFKPYKDADAVSTALTLLFGDSAEMKDAVLCFEKHLLPMPQSVCNLLYAIGMMIGVEPEKFKNVAGDIAWDSIRTVCTVVIFIVSRRSPSTYGM